MTSNTSKSIEYCFTSQDFSNENCEPANIADVIGYLSDNTKKIALAITPNSLPGEDAFGGHVASLTEAVMGISQGLMAISVSIDLLASAISHK